MVNNAGRMWGTSGFLLRTAGALHHHDTGNKSDAAGRRRRNTSAQVARAHPCPSKGLGGGWGQERITGIWEMWHTAESANDARALGRKWGGAYVTTLGR